MSNDLSASRSNSVFLSLANIFFHIVHLAIILFFLFGWLSEKTIIAHCILSALILFSWCVLGLYFGFGYCLCTDIQWRIKRKMGEQPSTEYYIKYILDKLTGLDTNPKTVNAITTYSFFSILILSSVRLLFSKLT